MNTTNHIAILVHSVDHAAKFLAGYGFEIGPKQSWDGEGTSEIYVGEKSQTTKLLLMEPSKPGAYRRALERRGPGLHHVAVDVTSLHDFVIGLSGSGWYLHPKSLQTIRQTKTAWLARPGTKMLIEVQERKDVVDAAMFISRCELPLTKKEQTMVAALNTKVLVPSKDDCTWLMIGERRINLADLLAPHTGG
ncbi:MAG: VOC family protein [Proteobacteria bacterium]|nr:VOC family protein [Pseudomonadota bacterium]